MGAFVRAIFFKSVFLLAVAVLMGFVGCRSHTGGEGNGTQTEIEIIGLDPILSPFITVTGEITKVKKVTP